MHMCVSVMFWCVSCYYFWAFVLLCVAHVYHVLPPAIKRACICVAVKSSYVIPLVYKSVFSLLVVVLVRVIPTTAVQILQKQLKDQTGLTQIFVPLQIALEDNFFARCSYSFLPVYSYFTNYKRDLGFPVCHFV